MGMCMHSALNIEFLLGLLRLPKSREFDQLYRKRFPENGCSPKNVSFEMAVRCIRCFPWKTIDEHGSLMLREMSKSCRRRWGVFARSRRLLCNFKFPGCEVVLLSFLLVIQWYSYHRFRETPARATPTIGQQKTFRTPFGNINIRTSARAENPELKTTYSQHNSTFEYCTT